MRLFTLLLAFVTLSADAQFLRFSRRPLHFPHHRPFTNNPPNNFFVAAGDDKSITTSPYTLEAWAEGCTGTPTFAWAVVDGVGANIHFADTSVTNTSITLDAPGSYTLAIAGLCGSVSRNSTVRLDYFPMLVTNTPPVFAGVTNITHVADASTYRMRFTLTDDRTASSALSVGVSSTPTTLGSQAVTYISGNIWEYSFVLPPTNQPPNSANLGTKALKLVAIDGDGSRTTNSSTVTLFLQPQQPFVQNFVFGPSFSTNENTVLRPLGTIIGDSDTPLNLLTIALQSTKPSVLPQSGVSFTFNTNTGAFLPILTPANNATGDVVLQITVTDNQGLSTFGGAHVTWLNVNTTPSIYSINGSTATTPLVTATNGVFRTVPFTLFDPDDAASALITDATSSASGVVPTVGLVTAGTTTNRTISFTPIGNGTATITLQVLDAAFASATKNFTLSVVTVNTAPTIVGPGPQSTSEDVPGPFANLAYTLGDAEQTVGSLLLSVTSSNPTLTPTLTLGGSGASRTLTIGIATNQNGTAVITAIVNDGALTATNSTLFTVNAVNDRPRFSAPITTKTLLSGSTLLVQSAATDVDNTPASLVFTGSVVNTGVATISTVTNLGGTASFTITGVASGTTTASVTVTDLGGAKDTNTFTINVTLPVQTAPTITGLVNHSIPQSAFDTQTVTVGDAETGAATLVLSALSGNTALVPVANVVFSGSGASRTVTVTPVVGQSGTATITIRVQDPTGLISSQSFILTVVPSGGNTFYVSLTGGSAANNGLTPQTPWDLTSVKNRATKNLAAGTTLIALPGRLNTTSRQMFTGFTQSGAPVIFRAMNRPYQTDRSLASVVDFREPTIGIGVFDVPVGQKNNIRFQGFEFMNSSLRHHFPDANTDRGNAFYVTGRGDVQIMGNCIRDSGNGIGFEDDASIPDGDPIIAFNNIGYGGVCGTDDCQHGHGLYIQLKNPNHRGYFVGNTSQNNMGQGLQVRGGDEALEFFNLIEDYNVFYNNGLPGGSRTRNFYHGGGERATNYVFRTNYCYYPGPDGGPQLFANTFFTDSGHVGSGPNFLTNLVVQGNTIINGGVTFGRWKLAHLIGNRIQSTSQQPGWVWQNQFGTLGDYLGSNTMYGVNNYTLDGSSVTKAAFTAASGGANFAASDTFGGATMPAFVDVVVNPWDTDEAKVIVWNPSGASTVTFSVGSFMAIGTPFEAWSTTSWYQRWSNGSYGGSITLSMVNLPMLSMVGFDGAPGFAGSPQSPGPLFAEFRLFKNVNNQVP